MRIESKYLAIVNLVFIILLGFFIINTIVAQSNEHQKLIGELKKIEVFINTLNIELDNLQIRFAQLNTDIFRLKTELRIDNNPLKRMKLEGKLKEASKYADRIKQINIQIEELKNKLKSNYKKIIESINQKINVEIKKFNSTDDSSFKTAILEKVNLYEREKQKYVKLLNENIPTVVEDKSIETNPNDNLDRLNLKLDLIKDRIAFLNEEENYLFKKRTELNSDLLIYMEMSDFINDIQRNIDEEQEFYDPDRTEQINQSVKEIKNKLKSLNERLLNITKSKNYYNGKLNEFNNYKKSFLFH